MKTFIRYSLYVINIILYITAIITFLTIPEYPTFNISLTISNLCLTIFLLYEKKKDIQLLMKQTYFKKFLSYALTTVYLILILGLINYLGHKYPYFKDFTQNKANTLPEQSLNLIKKISSPLKFTAFIRRTDQNRIIPLLELYKMNNNLIEIDLVDPDLRPDLIKKYKINKYGSILVEYKNKTSLTSENTVVSISQTLLKVLRTKRPSIYYAIGHGEPSLLDKGPQGVKHLGELLSNDLYNLQEIYLTSEEALPKDLDLLIIWGPTQRPLKNEIEKISNYLASGGHLLLAIDPNLNETPAQELISLIEKKGIKYNNDYIIDKKTFINGSEGTVPVVTKYNLKHQITQNFSGQTFFPLVSSLSINKKYKDKFLVSPLLVTSDHPFSWGEKNASEIITMKMKYGNGDTKGPCYIAMASEERSTQMDKVNNSKIVFFGNSTFIQNRYIKYKNNFNLFLNSVSWSVNEEFKISNNPTQSKQAKAYITSQEIYIILIVSVLLGPAILIGLSIYFYIRRKKR